MNVLPKKTDVCLYACLLLTSLYDELMIIQLYYWMNFIYICLIKSFKNIMDDIATMIMDKIS